MAKKPKSEDTALTPEVVQPPEKLPGNGAADRNEAYRIRKAIQDGEAVPPEKLVWLTQYEKAKDVRGASRSRKVSYTSEEMEAASTGDTSAAIALSAPQLAREEGRRIDSLIKAVTESATASSKQTQAAFTLLLSFATAILDRNGQLEQHNISAMEAVGKSSRRLAEAHAALVQQQAEHEADAITRDAEDAAKEREEEGSESDAQALIATLQQFMAMAQAGAASVKNGGQG